PLTGKERWSYDSKVPRDKGYGDFANRGASAWTSPSGHLRLFLTTIDARLIAVDAATGKACPDFGDNGVVNLRNGLRIPPDPNRFADRKSTRLNSSHVSISYAVFCLKKKKCYIARYVFVSYGLIAATLRS